MVRTGFPSDRSTLSNQPKKGMTQMGILHKFVKKAFGALPETDCGSCLMVRQSVEGIVLAAETALSRKLDLTVGDKIGTEHSNLTRCLEIEAPTVAETKAFMEELGMSPAEFAEHFGMDRAKFIAFLEQAEPDARLELQAA